MFRSAPKHHPYPHMCEVLYYDDLKAARWGTEVKVDCEAVSHPKIECDMGHSCHSTPLSLTCDVCKKSGRSACAMLLSRVGIT
jgi:hypothetical protein